MSGDVLERFRVRTPEGDDVRVDARTVDIDDRKILRFHDARGIKAQFLRWENYVCEGPASQGPDTATGSGKPI